MSPCVDADRKLQHELAIGTPIWIPDCHNQSYSKSILCPSKRAANVSRVCMFPLWFGSCFHVDVALSQAPTEWLPKLVAMEDQRCQMWRSSICNDPNERFQSHQRIQTFMHVHTMKHWNATVQVKLLIKATLTAWTSVADLWRFCGAHYQQEVRCLHQIGRTLSSLHSSYDPSHH